MGGQNSEVWGAFSQVPFLHQNLANSAHSCLHGFVFRSTIQRCAEVALGPPGCCAAGLNRHGLTISARWCPKSQHVCQALLALMPCTHNIPMMPGEAVQLLKWCPNAFHGMHGHLSCERLNGGKVGSRVACPRGVGECLGVVDKCLYGTRAYQSPWTCTLDTFDPHGVHVCRGK